MGKQNIAFIYGRVSKRPIISKKNETEYNYGMVYIDTVRSLRKVEDCNNYIKHDHPLIMSAEKEILDKMSEWQENDIVFIKGTVTSRSMEKTSYCPACKDENGVQFANHSKGNLVYITPIYAERLRSYGDDKRSAVQDVVNNMEISNQVYVIGTLIREPKIFKTKKGAQITQYQIAINRKFLIRTDNPNFKTDYPMVKSYGEHAREDKIYLRYQAEVLIDGYLQARTVKRKCTCANCGKIYEWADHLMELVPYDTEYISGQKTNEEIEAEFHLSVEALKQQLFDNDYKDELEDDLKSEDIVV